MTNYFYLFQTLVCLYPNSNLDKGNYSKQKDIQLIKGGDQSSPSLHSSWGQIIPR